MATAKGKRAGTKTGSVSRKVRTVKPDRSGGKKERSGGLADGLPRLKSPEKK